MSKDISSIIYGKTGKPSYYGPGDAGDTKNHGAEFASKTATGRKLNHTDDAVAVPFRSELARQIDIIEGRPINTNEAALGDLILARNITTGKTSFVLAHSNGGLDKDGVPTADLDFITGAYKEMGFKGVPGEMEYTVIASLNAPAEVTQEHRDSLQNVLNLTAKNERIPIHRRTEANPVSSKDWSSFETSVASLRRDLYLPSNYQIVEALKTIEKVNNGEASVDQLKHHFGAIHNESAFQEGATIADIGFSKSPDGQVATVTADGSKAYTTDGKRNYNAEEQHAFKRHLTDRQAKRDAFDSNPDVTDAQRAAEHEKRRREDSSLAGYLNDLAQENPVLAFILSFIAVAFGADPEELGGVYSSSRDTRESSNSPSRGAGDYYSSSSSRYAPGALKNFDLSNIPQGESNLSTAKGAAQRDVIKAQYVQGLEPYLFKGEFSEIPEGAKVVVLDPGHIASGLDLGATMTVNGKTMSEAGSMVAATVAQAKEFHGAGVVVLSTIQTQAFVDNTLSHTVRKSFMQKVDKAVEARGGELIASISNHYNDADSKTANGPEVFVSNSKSNSQSNVLGEAALKGLADSGMFKSSRGMKGEYEGQHSKGIAVVNNSFNGFLIEYGFQKTDGSVLANNEAMAKLGSSTARNIIDSGNRNYGWGLSKSAGKDVAGASQDEGQSPAEESENGKEQAAINPQNLSKVIAEYKSSDLPKQNPGEDFIPASSIADTRSGQEHTV